MADISRAQVKEANAASRRPLGSAFVRALQREPSVVESVWPPIPTDEPAV